MTTISFDFTAHSQEGKEAYILVAEDIDTFTGVYFLGCDGGHGLPSSNGLPNTNGGCRLTISGFGGEVASGDDFDLTVGASYHLEAVIEASGDMTITLSDSAGTLGSLSGSVGDAVVVTAVGFIVGRDETADTCLDNFDYSAD